MARYSLFSSFLFTIFLFSVCKEKPIEPPKEIKPIPKISYPFPKENEPNPTRIELGKILFFDPIVSGSNWISCATCHNPGLAWTDGLKTAIGHNMKVLGKNTPTIINSAFGEKMFWDGRADSLEEQALGPISSPDEMNQNPDELVLELKKIKGYRDRFERAYPNEGITKETIGKAIASFERSILSFQSPYDAWIQGDNKAINESAQRGQALFKGKANCIACHLGNNFTDDGFHNIGIKSKEKDPGRFKLVPVKSMKGAFKTPTLRDVALTAPYMHDGSYQTLEEVVDHYDRGGDDLSNLDPNMKPLKLSEEEKKDLISFMRSLTGKREPISIPTFPR
ncbi:cytochrome-c peroxidase [Leptospira stimsonii]|uniref:Methylamine utilization protein MauG n=1 Tax=Leptospira stimsonii TaxID=2202203 RepID=A0A8B3CL57_9LEPT|nr:cytochrome c peroxidase [Leptospira stimsonii]RHX83315.1 tryptophan tryptophylquinone biosynthesis enzyme MauG [Leptospira stimsonii]